MNYTPEETDAILTTIELDITEECDSACVACVRSSGQAPSKERMSYEQVWQFLKTSIMLDWKWESIALVGGEPTMHPRIHEIVKLLNTYGTFNDGCRFKLLTNGGYHSRAVLPFLPPWLEITNTSEFKKKPNNDHNLPFNVAPIDVGEWDEDNQVKCERPFRCGMGLTKDGFYGCQNAGGIDRVMKLGINIKTLGEVSIFSIMRKLHLACQYCGFYFEAGDRWKDYDVHTVTESWRKAYEEYNAKS